MFYLALATQATDAGAPHHQMIQRRPEAQEHLEATTAELLYAASQRLCAARLPKSANGARRDGPRG